MEFFVSARQYALSMQIAILPSRIPLKRYLSMCHPLLGLGVIILHFVTVESNRKPDNGWAIRRE